MKKKRITIINKKTRKRPQKKKKKKTKQKRKKKKKTIHLINNTRTTKLLIPLKCLVGHFYTFLGFKKKTIDLILATSFCFLVRKC